MIYISGPMTGYADLNFPAFNFAATSLRKRGWEVLNPVELNPDPKADWYDCIIDDIQAMKQCNAIYLLYGWEQSHGANIEYWVAKKNKMLIYYQANDY